MDNRVKYWLDLADYDIDTARGMLKIEKYLYVGFMCHQTIEKALKAIIANGCANGEMPPKIHHLMKLAEMAELLQSMPEEQKDLLRRLNPLHIEARYPESGEWLTMTLTDIKCAKIIAETEDLLCWIKQKL